jgi:hypothetical protein
MEGEYGGRIWRANMEGEYGGRTAVRPYGMWGSISHIIFKERWLMLWCSYTFLVESFEVL